jgi:prepilin-type N-terminal cleavage/methylation domain-containing protein
MKKINNKYGFSLIELSVVILVIGILVIGITQGSRIITQAKLSSARTLTKGSPVNSISNIVIWLDATSTDSITDSQRVDGSGTINTWLDVNPQATNKNNATAGVSPIYVSKAINGLPVVRFTGTQHLGFNGTSIANSNYTIFVVEQRTSSIGSSAGINYFIGQNPSSGGNNNLLHLGYRDNTTMTFAQFGNDYNATVAAYSKPTSYIHTFRFSSSQGKGYWRNGTNLINQTSGGALQGLTAYNNAAIGAYPDWPTYYIGNIGEIIIFNKALSVTEKSGVESYLSDKWGIAI